MNSKEDSDNYFRNARVFHDQPQTDSGRLAAEIARAKQRPLVLCNLEADQEFRNLVQHELKEGELLGEFISRIGLGKQQILSLQMTREDVSRFCRQAEENAANGPKPPAGAFQRKTVPSHFILD